MVKYGRRLIGIYCMESQRASKPVIDRGKTNRDAGKRAMNFEASFLTTPMGGLYFLLSSCKNRHG